MSTELLTTTPGTAQSRRLSADDVQDKEPFLIEHAEQTFSMAQHDSARSGRSASSKDTSIEVATADLRELVAFEFSLVPQVDHVYTALRDNGVFYTWIVTDEFDFPIRQEIYRRQRAIIDEFTMFEFDFYIIARQGRSVEDLIGDSSIHLTYKKPTH